MTTVGARLSWWRKRSDYLGDDVVVKVINRITYDSNGNEIKSTTAIVDLTIYTKSGRNAAERMERWIVPDADITNYLSKPAYYRKYTLTNRVMGVVFLGRRRRWW